MSKRIKRRILPRRRISGGLTIGSMINCADNTGARRLRIIQMVGKCGWLIMVVLKRLRTH